MFFALDFCWNSNSYRTIVHKDMNKNAWSNMHAALLQFWCLIKVHHIQKTNWLTSKFKKISELLQRNFAEMSENRSQTKRFKTFLKEGKQFRKPIAQVCYVLKNEFCFYFNDCVDTYFFHFSFTFEFLWFLFSEKGS